MIEDKFVDLYARNSGLRDKLVAERDVVLTYALHALVDAGVMEHLAFKGGTCLRTTRPKTTPPSAAMSITGTPGTTPAASDCR